jgi:hypothetical protein
MSTTRFHARELRPDMTGDDLELLVNRAAGGEQAAWRALRDNLEPWLESLVGKPRFFGGVFQRDDDRSNIVLEVLARLHADRFNRLKLYVDARRTIPGLTFTAWLRVLANRASVDYLRRHRTDDRHR